MSKTIKFEGDLTKDFMDFVDDTQKILFDSEDVTQVTSVQQLVEGTFQYIGRVLGEAKSEEEEIKLEVPGMTEFTVSYREGTGGNGNWGIGAKALDGLKKEAGIEDEE